MSKEVGLAIQEFQKFDDTYQSMYTLLSTNKPGKCVTFEKIDKDVLDQLSPDTLRVVDEETRLVHPNPILLQIALNLKERLAHEQFIEAKHINIAMMKYAMEIIDEEDKEEAERKKK